MTIANARREERVTAAVVSRRLKEMAAKSLDELGGIKYLMEVAQAEPQAYLQFLAKCIKNDDGAEAQGIVFEVQQLVIAAGPVPGVLNSPIREHVALKLVQQVPHADDD